MKSGIPWNLKRVDEDTRQAVIEAARRSGLSVGAWLNQVLAPDGQAYDEPDEALAPAPTASSDLAATLGQLREKLDRIERGLNPAPAERRQKSVPEMVAELAREIESPDERARTSVEGLRARTGTAPARPEVDLGDALRTLDRQVAGMGRGAAEPPPPAPAPASSPEPAGSHRLDDIRFKLDALLAQAPAPAAPERPEPAAAVAAALKALETRIEDARAEIGARDTKADGAHLARLEAQLAEITGRLAEPGPDRQQQRRDAELASAIREIAAHQRTIDDRAETTALRRDQKALSAAVAALRADIADLAERVQAIGRVSGDERNAFFDLSRRIDALAADAPVDRNLSAALRGDLETLHAMIEGGAREATLGALAAQGDGIAAQLNALMAGAPNRKQLERIGEDVVSLRRIVEADDSPRTIKRMEARLAEVGRAVEAAVGALPDSSAVLEQLEERLKEISGKVDTLRHSDMPAAVTVAVQAAQEQVEARLDDLVARLGSLFAALPRQAATLEALQERLQAVVQRIDALGRTRHEPSVALDAIQAEIRALRVEIAERPAADTAHLEFQMRELAHQIESVAAATPDIGALGALERQVDRLASELEEARPQAAAVAQVEENLARLQAMLADTTRESIVGARAEAQQAVTQLSELVAEYEIDSDLVRNLMGEIDALKNATGSHDVRTHERLETVGQTLAEVLDRLSRLEREGSVGAGEPSATLSIVAAPQQPAAEADMVAAAALPGKASDRRADFIAAARRAAHAAATQAAADQPPRPEAPAVDPVADATGEARKPGAFARISQAIRSRKRPLLLAAAAIVIAIGAMQIYGKLASAPDDDATISAAAVAPTNAAVADAVALAPDAAGIADAMPAAAPPAVVPTVPQVSQPAMIPPAATPSAAIAFAEPEVFANRFDISPKLPGSTGFGARAASTGETAPAAGAPVTLASAGDGDAATSAYSSGLDPRLGDDRLLRAADAGDPVAAFEVARRYAEGTTVPKNLVKAVEWYRRAAEGGIAVAQYRLASLYERGQGVARDRLEAADWYQRAADQGNVNAMHNLAVMMSEGVGGAPDHDKALQWFLAAANYGVRDSQYNLGVIYARGLGPAQDLPESYKWFAIAASGGDKDAAGRRDEVAKAMTREEFATATAAVAAWQVQPTLAEANGVATPAGGWDGPGDGIAEAEREALVRKIQILLAEQGYDPGPADGVAGPKTVDAVRAYQRRIGQPETGQIDSTLIAALGNGAM